MLIKSGLVTIGFLSGGSYSIILLKLGEIGYYNLAAINITIVAMETQLGTRVRFCSVIILKK